MAKASKGQMPLEVKQVKKTVRCTLDYGRHTSYMAWFDDIEHGRERLAEMWRSIVTADYNPGFRAATAEVVCDKCSGEGKVSVRKTRFTMKEIACPVCGGVGTFGKQSFTEAELLEVPNAS